MAIGGNSKSTLMPQVYRDRRLFEVVSRAYERQSLIVTTNLPFENWTEVCGSERLTGALLDRLTHRVHIIEANGQSYRLEQSRQRLARRKNKAVYAYVQGQDSSRIMELTLPANMLKPTERALLRVVAPQTGSRRWFRLYHFGCNDF